MSGNVLSAGQAALVLFGVFVGLLVIRVPVAFALGLACLPVLLIEPMPLTFDHVKLGWMARGLLNWSSAWAVTRARRHLCW